MKDFIELLFIVVVVALVIFSITCIVERSGINYVIVGSSVPVINTVASQNISNQSSTEDKSIILGGSNNTFGGKHKKGEASYDEYDDEDLLESEEKNLIKGLDNIIIDGNNFIYKFFEHDGHKGNISTANYFGYIEKIIKLLNTVLPKKKIFIILKDPENDIKKQKAYNYMEYGNSKGADVNTSDGNSHLVTEATTVDLVGKIERSYKKYFTELLKKYTRVRIIMAYGTAKSRDDFAAIWLSDQLGPKTILLSRDRYNDVNNTNESTETIKFVAYGKHSSKYNKLLNKSFAFIDRSSVKVSLIGYTFNKKRKTAFYSKKINRRSNASKYVFVINVPVDKTSTSKTAK